jgi:hypothetical protein
MVVLQDKSQVNKLHNKLMRQLGKHESERIMALSGHKGHSYEKKVSYSKELNIWWDMGTTSEGRANSPRYWNAFGIGRPVPGKVANIICEINYPVKGINKRVAANWVIDGKEIFLVHSGKIGGGRIGIGKTSFIDHYSGVFYDSNNPDLPEEITTIGQLGDSKLAYQIANFVHEVSRIKDLIVGKNKKSSNLSKSKHAFNEEFVGTKQYKGRKNNITATVNHGLVVNTLKDILVSKKNQVANNRQRDLYTYTSSGQITTVFEVKTSLSSQSIFTAIGQLYVNNIRISPMPKLIYVIPEKPNRNLTKTLEALKVEILIYSWKKGKPHFKNLDKII